MFLELKRQDVQLPSRILYCGQRCVYSSIKVWLEKKADELALIIGVQLKLGHAYLLMEIFNYQNLFPRQFELKTKNIL